MNFYSKSILILLSLCILACTNKQEEKKQVIKESVEEITVEPSPRQYDYDTLLWKEVTEADHGVVLDIKYATKDNFTNRVIYDCGRCFLRSEVADRIIRLNRDISRRYGWRIKLFDCYRPRPAQQKLWDIVPDAHYVTPPHKGSMHNRGLAVDLTIVDKDGHEWDMGSPYDSFSKASHTDHNNFSSSVVKNRKILYKLMELSELSGIRTEWWHYSYKGRAYPLDDWQWECPE